MNSIILETWDTDSRDESYDRQLDAVINAANKYRFTYNLDQITIEQPLNSYGENQIIEMRASYEDVLLAAMKGSRTAKKALMNL